MTDSSAARAISFDKLKEAYTKVLDMNAPLRERLAIFDGAVRAYGLPFAEAYDDLVGRIRTGNLEHQTPKPGDLLPPFVLPDHEGRLVSLSELTSAGPLVVSFNRGHWCEYCGIELKTLADERPEIAARGARIVTIVPEQSPYLEKIYTHTDGKLIVLADTDNGYTLSLGLVIWLGDRVRKLYTELGLRVDEFQGNDAWFVPVPATFVVDRHGIVAARFVDPDFRRRMDVEDILAALARLPG